jgi:hypothetical protein
MIEDSPDTSSVLSIATRLRHPPDPIEPVSTVKFPANREINREFRRIRLLGTILKADTRANSEACSEIPYAIRTWNYFG